MEAIKKIINSNLLEGIIDLPENFKNHKLEIIIFPVSDEEKENIPQKKTITISDEVKAISGIIDLKQKDYKDFIAEERLK